MNLKRSLYALIILIVLLLVLSWVTGIIPGLLMTTQTPVREAPPQAQFSPERSIEAIGNKTFSALVSFSGTRFEPKTARVRAGEMVRFFNSSNQMMHISATDPAYPGKNATCRGMSPLDTCNDLPPGEYWEFTFTTAGTWNFTDTLSGTQGTVIAQ